MDKSKGQGQTLRPVHMALCRRCLDGVSRSYGERAEELGTVRAGVCGLCCTESMVFGVDLYPQARRSFRRQDGGGERKRAGRTA